MSAAINLRLAKDIQESRHQSSSLGSVCVILSILFFFFGTLIGSRLTREKLKEKSWPTQAESPAIIVVDCLPKMKIKKRKNMNENIVRNQRSLNPLQLVKETWFVPVNNN